jgi:hypothetical protein
MKQRGNEATTETTDAVFEVFCSNL